MWIGFPGASKPGPPSIGMVIGVDTRSSRLDVLWGGGVIGRALYPETLKIIK